MLSFLKLNEKSPCRRWHSFLICLRKRTKLHLCSSSVHWLWPRKVVRLVIPTFLKGNQPSPISSHKQISYILIKSPLFLHWGSTAWWKPNLIFPLCSLRRTIWEPFTNSIIIALKDIKHALGQYALGGQLAAVVFFCFFFISCETTLWKLRLFSCFLMPWLAPPRPKPPPKPRIWAQFRSQGVLWTFSFDLSTKKPSNIVVSELISIVRFLNESVCFSPPYLAAWSNLSNTRVGD